MSLSLLLGYCPADLDRLVVQQNDALAAMEICHCHVLGIPKNAEQIPIVQNGLLKGKLPLEEKLSWLNANIMIGPWLY